MVVDVVVRMQLWELQCPPWLRRCPGRRVTGWLFCFGGLQFTGLHVAGGSDVVELNLTAHGVVVEPLIVEGVGRRLLLLWLKAVGVVNARGRQFIVLSLL